jgi:hypothetical protein
MSTCQSDPSWLDRSMKRSSQALTSLSTTASTNGFLTTLRQQPDNAVRTRPGLHLL